MAQQQEDWDGALDLLRDVMSAAAHEIPRLSVQPGRPQQLWITLLLIRIHEACESALVLAERELNLDSLAISRIAMEAKIVLCAIAHDESLLRSWFSDRSKRAAKTTRRMQRFSPPGRTAEEEEESRRILEAIEATIQDEKHLQELAIASQQEDEYVGLYGFLCGPTHLQPDGFAKYIDRDATGNFLRLHPQRSTQHLALGLGTCAGCLFECLKAAAAVFGVKLEPSTLALSSRFSP